MLTTTQVAVAICALNAVTLEQPTAGQQSSPPLDGAITVGQTVSVQTTDGRTLEGTVSAVSATVLDLKLDSRTTNRLTIERIRQVDLKYHDPSRHATKKRFYTRLTTVATFGKLVAPS